VAAGITAARAGSPMPLIRDWHCAARHLNTAAVLGGLGKNTDQIPRISGAHHFLSRIIGIKFPEFMPAAQRHLSKIWPFLPWRKLENQVEVFLLAF